MQKFKQLNLHQRYQIEALLQAGNNQTQTAFILGVDKSTISRELKRNIAPRGRGAGVYSAINAQRKTKLRHKTKPKPYRFTEALKEQAREWLSIEKLSPELIAGRWAITNTSAVSHETLYKWIWTAKHSNKQKHALDKKLYKELKHGKRRRKRGNYADSRGAIVGRVPISERPEVVNQRTRIGDIEVDLMMGKNHKSALLVMTDRTTLLTALEKLNGKNSTQVEDAIINRLGHIDSAWIKTLTFDNGKEFSYHQTIGQALNAKTYFTRPYTSQDKGTVENRIGVIRRFFPKKTDLRKINTNRIKQVEYFLNNRPIRKFNYLSPIQVLKNRCVAFIT